MLVRQRRLSWKHSQSILISVEETVILFSTVVISCSAAPDITGVWLNVYTFSHTPVIFVGMPSLRSVFGSQITTWFMPQCVMLSNKNSSVSVSQINVYQNFNGQSPGFKSSGSSSLRILDGKLQYGTRNGDYNPSLTWWALLDPDQPIEAS